MTNNMKKIICLGISATVVATAFAGCSAAKTSGKEEHTVAVTEIVTNSEGEAVTDESGEVVTEVVTDKNGLPVTKVVKDNASSSTSANSSTAAKSNGATKAGSQKQAQQKQHPRAKAQQPPLKAKTNRSKLFLRKTGVRPARQRMSKSNPALSPSKRAAITEYQAQQRHGTVKSY